MTRVFQAKWPAPARLEAFLLCIAGAWAVWHQPFVRQASAAWPVIAAGGLAGVLIGLIAVDRLLLARKGFAILSVAAAAAWATCAFCLPGATAAALGPLLPPGSGVPAAQTVAVAAGILALLCHLPALRKGLADRGFIALRLRADRDRFGPGEYGERANLVPNPRGRSRSLPSIGRRWRVPILAFWLIAALVRFGMPAGIHNLWARTYTHGAGQNTAVLATAPVLTATANGASVPLLFDPDASFIVLTAEDAKRLGVDTRFSRRDSDTRVSGGIDPVASATLPSVSIGGTQWRNLHVYVAEPGTLPESRYGAQLASLLMGR